MYTYPSLANFLPPPPLADLFFTTNPPRHAPTFIKEETNVNEFRLETDVPMFQWFLNRNLGAQIRIGLPKNESETIRVVRTHTVKKKKTMLQTFNSESKAMNAIRLVLRLTHQPSSKVSALMMHLMLLS